VIVVDTIVPAYLYLPGECTAQAEALLQRDPDWAAPVLWRSEIRNILAGCMRRLALSFEQARAVQAEAQSPLAGAVREVDSQHVLQLVRDSDCSTYDCEFVALTTTLGAKPATMGAKLLRTFPKHTISLTSSWRSTFDMRGGRKQAKIDMDVPSMEGLVHAFRLSS
jgi:predicted nucleic acid-binding protein